MHDVIYFTTRQLIFTLSQVFRDIEPESESENENENMQAVCLSIAAQMKMQANAAAAVKEKAVIEAHTMLPLPLPRIINYALLKGAMDWMMNMGPDVAGATV